jgi:hypothetical protein
MHLASRTASAPFPLLRPMLYFFAGRGLRMRNRMLTYDGVSMGAAPQSPVATIVPSVLRSSY